MIIHKIEMSLYETATKEHATHPTKTSICMFSNKMRSNGRLIASNMECHSFVEVPMENVLGFRVVY